MLQCYSFGQVTSWPPSDFAVNCHDPSKRYKKPALYPSHHKPRFDPPPVECLERVPPKVQHIVSLNVAVDRTTNPRISRSDVPRVAWQSGNVQAYPETNTRGGKYPYYRNFSLKTWSVGGRWVFVWTPTKRLGDCDQKQVKKKRSWIKERWMTFKCYQ